MVEKGKRKVITEERRETSIIADLFLNDEATEKRGIPISNGIKILYFLGKRPSK